MFDVLSDLPVPITPAISVPVNIESLSSRYVRTGNATNVIPQSPQQKDQQPSTPQMGIPQMMNGGPYVPFIGATYSLYLPTSARTRAVLGSQWQSIGPGFGPTFVSYGDRAKALQPDFGILQNIQDAKAGDNYALAIFLGLGQRRAFKQSVDVQLDENWKPKSIKVRPGVPYAGWAVQMMVTSVDLGPIGERSVGIGLSGSLMMGYTISRNAVAEVRYRQTTVASGFDFSGLEVRFGIRF
jgi:hypothetical protein